jgi:hypothetical protein
MSPPQFVIFVLLLAFASCSHVPSRESSDPWSKVELDLSDIDGNGLRGPQDGRVAVSYEFAIPNTIQCKTEVKAIDASVQFMPGSAGRIGAAPHECLCIGTAGRDFRQVLRRLAELPYVQRIIQCHFE